jgi:LysM domain-containing protein
MALPGEIPQEIGRAYARVLIGCLENTVRHFRAQFTVEEAPDKVTFISSSGASFSFDAIGSYHHPEIYAEALIECKGHEDGAHILEEYKAFLAKAYSTSVGYSRHQRDLFWFVTNVPFGSTIGRRLTSADFVEAVLTREGNKKVEEILGRAPVDKAYVQSLARRVAVCVFTDSYIRRSGVSYRVKPGESIWSILKALHAGRIPTPQFAPLAGLVQTLNDLKSPDRIRSGKRLLFPWYGLIW